MSIKIIGITGPSGSGKSLLCSYIRQMDIRIIDADEVYHSLLTPNSECTDALALEFGKEILDDSGAPNRQKLATIVFSSEERLKRLNSIVLGFVIKEINKQIRELDALGNKYVAVDAPTLIESGFNKECDAVISVISEKTIRVARIMKRDLISKERAMQRINAQKDDSFYKDNSDLVLTNNGSEEEFKEHIVYEFDRLLKKLK